MPVLLHQQPVLTLALDSFQDTTIDENDIRRMWILFTKCKDDIKNGSRLENISWRIWYKKYLNNTSDLFSNDNIYEKQSLKSPNPLANSIESNNSSISKIEPIEVIKRCACGEQLITSPLSSSPHTEYNCFEKQLFNYTPKSQTQPQPQPKSNITANISLVTEDEKETETKSTASKPTSLIKSNSENTLTSSIPKPQDTISSKKDNISIEMTTPVHPLPTDLPHNKSSIQIESTSSIKSEEVEGKKEKEEKEVKTTPETHISEKNIKIDEVSKTNTHTDNSNNTTAMIPTMEQFYQQQIVLLQQVYIQKQQQLQYQKQQMNVNSEQIYQQQMYLQQWFNQQQQHLLANCSIYYKKYLQQNFGSTLQSQMQTQKPTQTQTQTKTQKPLFEDYIDDDDDDYDDEDDDYFYSDEDDDDYNDDYNDKDEMDDDEYYEPVSTKKPIKDDMFRKVSTPSLKNKVNKPSLLSAMIKENNYNEYKKTVEIIQKYDDDAQKVSNNIYSIKDYNGNCINSLNKKERRKRAPSFEDVRNAPQGLRKLIELHPLYQNQTSGDRESLHGHEDVEEYYEKKSHGHFNINTTTNSNSSFSTVNTYNSQDSHNTAYITSAKPPSVYGSNKTTHSTHSTKSIGMNHRTTNNSSINLYMTKKRLNYSN